MIQLYTSEEINDQTSVMMVDNQSGSKRIINAIGNHGKLQSILNCKWELQIFDADNVSGESVNFISYLHKRENKDAKETCTLIAIRNFLLAASHFKDRTCSNKSIELIKKTLEDARLEDWSFNKHSFIWQFIHSSEHVEFEKRILTIMSQPEYTLSYYLKQKLPIDNELLRKKLPKIWLIYLSTRNFGIEFNQVYLLTINFARSNPVLQVR
ncbi:MAG: hypothetical protein HWD61_14135 [Parachlamydiaceae bacterium]|nr:MAG: hypothetical protein HWD61_14135 [Parachlamydiaceae bacterium]